MAVARYYSSLAQPTQLSSNISNVALSMPVDAVTGFPTSYPYTLAVEYGTSAEELVDVTNASGKTLTVTRGVDGTSAQSHPVGAVVRHVSSARDFADLQGHIAATGAVHGVAGTLVGTSDTQTLANKTLTSPAISAAALSGTLTGAPTFSGGVVFTGTPSLRAASAATAAYGVRVSGDSQDRLQVGADGKLSWGSGAAAADAVLSRAGAGTLGVGALLQASRAATTDGVVSSLVGADTVERWRAYADGRQEWGPGGATARDTTLYRNAAGELKTDTALTVLGALSAGNMALGAWTSWTPAWSTTTGVHTPGYGNAVVTGGSVKLGRLLICTVGIAFGSSTTFGSGATTADNWSFSIPGGASASATFAGAKTICGFGRITQTTGATIPVAVRVDANATTFTLDTSGGRQDGTSITNTGIVDALTPWTWVSGNEIAFFAVVETTA